jgi:ribosomal protein L34E
VSRAPEIAFSCPGCGREATAGPDGAGRCGACARETVLDVAGAVIEGDPPTVARCAACGNGLLYVQRDFNQKVGLAIVIAGGLLAPFTPFYSSLFVAGAVDACLYLMLPEITVCYRCHAHYRGFARNRQHQAFDLHLAEQYDVHPPGG